MTEELVIYTSENCPSCKRIKAILKKENISYKEMNMDDEENFLGALTYQIATVPTLRIGDKTFFAKKATREEILNFIKDIEK
jgi:glutaredoxin